MIFAFANSLGLVTKIPRVNTLVRYLYSRFISRKAILHVPSGLDYHRLLEKHSNKVTIVIPTRDKVELLEECVASILKFTNFDDYEIFIIDNNSSNPNTQKYLNSLDKSRFTVLSFPHDFNYSKICNFAAQSSEADFLCFLNNDTLVTDPNWLNNLVSHAKSPNVGVVGSRLMYPDGRLQHLGVVLGKNGLATHLDFRNLHSDPTIESLNYPCFEVTAVTFACVVVSRANYFAIGAMDIDLPVGLNDVDFCLRARGHGFSVLVCGDTQLIHIESATRPKALSFKGFRQGTRDLTVFLGKHGWPAPDEFFEFPHQKSAKNYRGKHGGQAKR